MTLFYLGGLSPTPPGAMQNNAQKIIPAKTTPARILPAGQVQAPCGHAAVVHPRAERERTGVTFSLALLIWELAF
jgi:hypothetical protein